MTAGVPGVPARRSDHVTARSNPFRRFLLATAGLCWAVVPSFVSADCAVTISGGPDEAGVRYVWEIQHDCPSPLIGIDFDHYMADLFEPPAVEGWKVPVFTGKVGLGHITATADSPSYGVRPHTTATISLKTGRIGSVRALGTMQFRFADGSQLSAQAYLPTPPPPGDQFGPLIGLGVIFAGFVLYRFLRGRRKTAVAAPSGD
jgi:hypothetical protein